MCAIVFLSTTADRAPAASMNEACSAGVTGIINLRIFQVPVETLASNVLEGQRTEFIVDRVANIARNNAGGPKTITTRAASRWLFAGACMNAPVGLLAKSKALEGTPEDATPQNLIAALPTSRA